MNILITGSTDGIGKQTALELARLGHNIFIHGRSSTRLSETENWILSQVPEANINCLKADFASLEEVKQMAETLLVKVKSLDILINNAGVFEKNLSYSTEGFERTFAINHLAHFYLSLLLLPYIKSQPSARIINVASNAQAASIDFEALNAEKGYNSYDAYELSKLCNILFTFKLARELKNSPVTINALHPGIISTKILHAGWGMGGESWSSGAVTSVFLAISSDGAQNTGEYYVNKMKSKANLAAYDLDHQDLLWNISLKMCGLKA